MMTDYRAKANEMAEIQDAMAELLERAKYLLRGTGMIERRAGAYWLAHIATALSDENEYMGRSMQTMADTIAELHSVAEDEADEDDDHSADPEACPTCGCRPGEGYTPDCPDCTDLMRLGGGH